MEVKTNILPLRYTLYKNKEIGQLEIIYHICLICNKCRYIL